MGILAPLSKAYASANFILIPNVSDKSQIIELCTGDSVHATLRPQSAIELDVATKIVPNAFDSDLVTLMETLL